VPVPAITIRQAYLPEFCPVTLASTEFASAGIDDRGAIFTKREVVDFILDLVGYTADRPLHELRLLEPSFGAGDFLLPALSRLLTAWIAAGRPSAVPNLQDSIRAVELHRVTFHDTKTRVMEAMVQAGIRATTAQILVDSWLISGDFLLTPLSGTFDFVVGNPPYIRQERIPEALMEEYRARYLTIYDRADIYVPFIERSLSVLKPKGGLGFICADRWMKNRYGALLRKMVADQFRLKVYVDMTDTAAFHTEVIAYPAITVITREKATSTTIACQPKIEATSLRRLATKLLLKKVPAADGDVREVHNVTAGEDPWILESSDQIALARRLETDFPLLEDAGCKVGIGVATGADKAYIAMFDELDVEPGRKLPLVMTRDILNGDVQWRGFGVINPFGDDGRLVELKHFPKLGRYLELHREQILGRHVAKKAPANWYRTIDRIYPELARKPKLLIPDIKGEAHIVHEDGKLYPHHNLYFITSDTWHLKALQAVLLSGIARLFVAIYSTKMRGGFLRFQAQYLRRIRLPNWDHVPINIRRDLIKAAESKNVAACNKSVFALYGLNKKERIALGGSDTDGN
jgi:hypothetical protein